MSSKANNEAKKIVDIRKIEDVDNTFWFDYEQTLKWMYYFLNLFPLVGIFLYFEEIAFNNLVDFLVFFNENEEKVVRSLSNFSLSDPICTF